MDSGSDTSLVSGAQFTRTVELPRISDYPRYHATHAPDRLAIAFGETQWSWAHFERALEACARALMANGVVAGDRVAMLSTPRPEYLVVFMATARIGAIWMGLNPRYRREELEFLLRDASPTLLLTIAAFEERDYLKDLSGLRVGKLAETPLVVHGDLGDSINTLSWESFIASGREMDTNEFEAAVDQVRGADPALIVYTSGSTGRPKGALLSHRRIVATTRIQCEHWWAEPFRILNNMPINHVGGAVQIACHAIVAGGTNVMMERFSPARIPDVIAKHGVSVIHQVATQYQMLLEHVAQEGGDLSSLQTVVWSGAPASAELIAQLRQFTPNLFTSYGSTEVGGEVLYMPPNSSPEMLASGVGCRDPRIELRIVDDKGNSVEPGQEGEIQVRGPTVMLGYFNNPEATGQTITDDGFVRTGDLAACNEQGIYRIVGRLKEMFKSGGYNVYPREIERVLEDSPVVSEAVVVGVPDDLYSEVGFAYVRPVDGVSPDFQELRQHCRERLANYKVPKHFEVCNAWPMLSVGKVDRKSLKQQASAQIEG